jgi:hypothetical protein
MAVLPSYLGTVSRRGSPRRRPGRRSRATVRARPAGTIRTLSVSHSTSVSYGVFVRARRALDGSKRRFPARAVTGSVEPVRTYQDLIKSPHDELLFAHCPGPPLGF